MTAFNRTPENTNPLQATKFLLTFDRLGSTQYFCQSVNIPGLNLGQAPINTPMLDVFAPGNKITYNPLSINFIVDEKLDGWQQIHSWFRSIASPESYEERKRLTAVQNQFSKSKLTSYSDATLTVLSALNNPILRFKFINVFPITLSDIIFDTRQSAEDVITSDVVFLFDYFNIEPLDN
jgi:hypothetical protein